MESEEQVGTTLFDGYDFEIIEHMTTVKKTSIAKMYGQETEIHHRRTPRKTTIKESLCH